MTAAQFPMLPDGHELWRHLRTGTLRVERYASMRRWSTNGEWDVIARNYQGRGHYWPMTDGFSYAQLCLMIATVMSDSQE